MEAPTEHWTERFRRQLDVLFKSSITTKQLLERIMIQEETEAARRCEEMSMGGRAEDLSSDKLHYPESARRRVVSPRKPRGKKEKAFLVADDMAVIWVTETEKGTGKAKPPAGEKEMSERQPQLLSDGDLRPYQINGLQWMKMRFETGANGILADAKGLGKTMQCLAMLAHLMQAGCPGPFLVVAPPSVIPHWLAELERFAPQIPVILYEGEKFQRKKLILEIKKKHPILPGLRTQSVVVVSTELAVEDRHLLKKFTWTYIVMDQDDGTKVINTRLIRDLQILKSVNRVLLTNVPMQTNLVELFTVLYFLLPESFEEHDSFEFWFDLNHLSEMFSSDRMEREQKQGMFSMLHQILNAFTLRRMRSEVERDIPPRKEILAYATMTPVQLKFHQEVLDTIDLMKMAALSGEAEIAATDSMERRTAKDLKKKVPRPVAEGDAGGNEDDMEAWIDETLAQQESRASYIQKKVMQLLHGSLTVGSAVKQLRKSCSHPYLLDHPVDPRTKQLVRSGDLISSSGKMELLDNVLKHLKKKEFKVVIFSQMTRILDLIEDFCKFRRHRFCRVKETSAANCNKAMETFKQAKEMILFLLPARTKYPDLYLPCTDAAILFDADWNPETDLQDQICCYGIGQVKPVMVFWFATAGTIDQKIVEGITAQYNPKKMLIRKGKFEKGDDSFGAVLEPYSAQEILDLLWPKDEVAETEPAPTQEPEEHETCPATTPQQGVKREMNKTYIVAVSVLLVLLIVMSLIVILNRYDGKSVEETGGSTSSKMEEL